eukprot:TRINITY_DN778_c5_g1_i1.p1 TRINITY_DN778_c5_g1~~TRINITY_DN778_c5_g1_i1.p1  ORF type:complete len:360 (+),score=71.52 TRINITY_DN778_c5_g1_i1:65-1081(+)
MNNETAINLTKLGGSILVLEFPVKGCFGIDMKTWVTGDKFKGIKMIPEGVHLVSYSNGSEMAAVCSFFVEVKKGSQLRENITIGKWDAETETINILSDEEAEPYKKSVSCFEFDDGLAPYPLEAIPSWKVLSNMITQSDIERVRPVQNTIYSSSQPAADGTEIDPHGPTANLFFAKVSDKPPEGVSLSTWNFDGSHKLAQLTKKTDSSGRAVLADLQLSFVMFLISQNYSAFEHWKLLLRIICTSESMLSSNKMLPFFQSFCSVLLAQLGHIPPEFYELDAAYLPHQIAQFKELQADILDVNFRRAADLLFAKSEELFGSLSDDDDDVMVVSEDAPQY